MDLESSSWLELGRTRNIACTTGPTGGDNGLRYVIEVSESDWIIGRTLDSKATSNTP